MPPTQECSEDPEGDDHAVFARLTTHLAGYGLSAEVSEHPGPDPLLHVANAAGPSTFVFVAPAPLHDEWAVYAFDDLYVGRVTDLKRVAACLAWLLGTPIPPAATTFATNTTTRS